MRNLISAGAALLAGCTALPASAGEAKAETCIASVYWEGARLADGSRWSRQRSERERLAAHRSARLGSHLRVTRLDTGATVLVPVRDRGPFVRGRCIDLSLAAARTLGITGRARVRVEPAD